MRYFQLWEMGSETNKALAFVRDPPSGLCLRDYYMRTGERIGEHYPKDAKVNLDPRRKGIKLESVLGNILSYLMVNTQAKALILSICSNEIETLPFTLYNHKKRVHSNDYWILNPIGTFDCVNREASEIIIEDDEIIGVESVTFDSRKMKAAPDLFRVPEKPEWYFVSETLARAFKNAKLTNIIFKAEISLKPGK